MNHKHIESRQYGLTLSQWIILFVAFMLGVGGTFIVREVFLPESVYAATVQPMQVQPAQRGQIFQAKQPSANQSVLDDSVTDQ